MNCLGSTRWHHEDVTWSGTCVLFSVDTAPPASSIFFVSFSTHFSSFFFCASVIGFSIFGFGSFAFFGSFGTFAFFKKLLFS